MVEGYIEFVPERPRFDAADVHVWIEDTTYADADAVRLFHLHMPNVSYAGDPAGLAFKLDYEAAPAESRTYTLSALVDLDGDGVPGRGDYISDQAVRLPEDGRLARVRVRRIESAGG